MRLIITTDQDRETFINRTMSIPLKGRRFVAEFKMFKVQRTPKQNRLYWSYLRFIRDEHGNTEKELHECFKQKFLSWEAREILGEDVSIRTSTSQLTTKEFSEYIEHIRDFMHNEIGLYIPTPEDREWDQFYAQYGMDTTVPPLH